VFRAPSRAAIAFTAYPSKRCFVFIHTSELQRKNARPSLTYQNIRFFIIFRRPFEDVFGAHEAARGEQMLEKQMKRVVAVSEQSERRKIRKNSAKRRNSSQLKIR